MLCLDFLLFLPPDVYIVAGIKGCSKYIHGWFWGNLHYIQTYVWIL
jgi:hypothetical protein